MLADEQNQKLRVEVYVSQKWWVHVTSSVPDQYMIWFAAENV